MKNTMDEKIHKIRPICQYETPHISLLDKMEMNFSITLGLLLLHSPAFFVTCVMKNSNTKKTI